MKKNYTTGTFAEYAESHRGWMSGQFFPEGDLKHSKLVEIKVIDCGPDFRAAKHQHREGTAWVLVTKGAVNFLLDDEPLTVRAGEFVIQSAACREEITGAEEGSQFVAIHAPSIPNNKVVLE